MKSHKFDTAVAFYNFFCATFNASPLLAHTCNGPTPPLHVLFDLTCTHTASLPVQYHADMRQGHDVYSKDTLNVLVRRKGKENNFKAVLETIRDLMAAAAAGQVRFLFFVS